MAVAKKVAKKRPVKRTDSFRLYMPHCELDGRELPVISKTEYCLVFSSKRQMEHWARTHGVTISSVKRFSGKAKIPAMINAAIVGVRPKGIYLNINPDTADYKFYNFQSGVNDRKRDVDIQPIFDLVSSSKEKPKGLRAITGATR